MKERLVPRNHAEILRDEMVMRDRVLEALRQGPRTVPEIAAVLQYPSSEVLKWLMALRRYGLVVELPKPRAEDYYRYRVAGDKEESC